jgi:hypothetical protein
VRSGGAEIFRAADAVVAAGDLEEILASLRFAHRPEYLAAVLRRGVTGQTVDAGKQRRRDAGAAYLNPIPVAFKAVRVVFRDVPGDRRDIIRGSICAARIVLPDRT